MLFRQATARRASGLYGFELLAVLDAAADFIDYLTQGSSHRYFNQTYIINLTSKGKYFRTL